MGKLMIEIKFKAINLKENKNFQDSIGAKTEIT